MSAPRTTVTSISPLRALAVVVLYGLSPRDSPALQSLEAILQATGLAESISLFVWDNTPGDRHPPDNDTGAYHHDPANSGLCTAYNAALQRAAETGCTWLFLFDQDTAVTERYLREALNVCNSPAIAESATVVALVPRLVHKDTIVSPFQPAVQGPVQAIAPTLSGIAIEPLQAFNSGAVLRVAAVQALGGFDTAFPLDYLDHATFAALQRAGGHVYVLDATLQHDLATHTQAALDDKAFSRQVDILAAEHRFIAKYGTRQQRRMMPVRTLRHALSVLVHKRDLRHALLILKTALVRP